MLLSLLFLSSCAFLTTALPPLERTTLPDQDEFVHKVVSISNTNIDPFFDTSNIGFVPAVTEGAIINSEVIVQEKIHPTVVVDRQRNIPWIPQFNRPVPAQNYIDDDLFSQLNNQLGGPEAG